MITTCSHRLLVLVAPVASCCVYLGGKLHHCQILRPGQTTLTHLIKVATPVVVHGGENTTILNVQTVNCKILLHKLSNEPDLVLR